MQSPDEPRDSLSSSANDTPRAPPRCVTASEVHSAVSPQRSRPPRSALACSPGRGVRGGFRAHAGVQGSALAPASLRPPPEARAPAAGGRGRRLSPSDPAAEEGRVPRDRRRVRQASESGAPTSPAPAEGRGREIPSRVQNGGQEKRAGGPLSARAWDTDALTLGTSRAQSLGEMAERAPPPPASQKNGR